MNETFIALCAGVTAALELLKPAIKSVVPVEDTDANVYQAAIWLLAMLVGIAGAFAMQINVVPSYFHVSPVVGMVITGFVASFGSEVGHRVLEIIESLSQYAQNKATAAGDPFKKPAG